MIAVLPGATQLAAIHQAVPFVLRLPGKTINLIEHGARATLKGLDLASSKICQANEVMDTVE